MRGKSFGTEFKCMCVCVHKRTHITFGWCLDVPSVPGLHLWESGAGGDLENTRGSSRRREGERKRVRLLMHDERRGGRAVPRRNADCFHVWGGQESRVGCRQVRLAPNEKSCVGDGGGPRHCSPVAECSQS